MLVRSRFYAQGRLGFIHCIEKQKKKIPHCVKIIYILLVPKHWPKSIHDILENPSQNMLTQEDAGIMMREISLHTPPMDYVFELAEEFRMENLKAEEGSKYLAVHWRYDEKVTGNKLKSILPSKIGLA